MRGRGQRVGADGLVSSQFASPPDQRLGKTVRHADPEGREERKRKGKRPGKSRRRGGPGPAPPGAADGQPPCAKNNLQKNAEAGPQGSSECYLSRDPRAIRTAPNSCGRDSENHNFTWVGGDHPFQRFPLNFAAMLSASRGKAALVQLHAVKKARAAPAKTPCWVAEGAGGKIASLNHSATGVLGPIQLPYCQGPCILA